MCYIRPKMYACSDFLQNWLYSENTEDFSTKPTNSGRYTRGPGIDKKKKIRGTGYEMRHSVYTARVFKRILSQSLYGGNKIYSSFSTTPDLVQGFGKVFKRYCVCR